MAFPTTYNINYYKGDTYQFTLYPKTSTGAAFDMTDYEARDFIISLTRGGDEINATAALTAGNTGVVCTIPMTVGANLAAGSAYVYEIRIADTTPTPAVRFTLATGTITVTASVS
jgi:hypothetical protein